MSAILKLFNNLTSANKTANFKKTEEGDAAPFIQPKNDALEKKSLVEKEMSQVKEISPVSPVQITPREDSKEKGEQKGSILFMLEYQVQSKPTLKVTVKDIQKFLNFVAAGEQEKAEAMLKKNPNLALATGTITDRANRTFENITGFQYAVWTLDWHMWKMIRKYLPPEDFRKQVEEFDQGSWVAKYREHVDWNELTEAQQTLIDNWETWDWKRINDYWVKQIGGVQRLLPIHVLQEYNQSERPFKPCPAFDAEYSYRYRGLKRGHARNWERLGKTGAVYRAWNEELIFLELCKPSSSDLPIPLPPDFIVVDRQALSTLFTTRIRQRKDLVAELTKKPAFSPSP